MTIPAWVINQVLVDVNKCLADSHVAASYSKVNRAVRRYMLDRWSEVGWSMAVLDRGSVAVTDIRAICRGIARDRERPLHYRDPTANAAIETLMKSRQLAPPPRDQLPHTA